MYTCFCTSASLIAILTQIQSSLSHNFSSPRVKSTNFHNKRHVSLPSYRPAGCRSLGPRLRREAAAYHVPAE